VDKVSALNEATKAAFEQLQRQNQETETANKAMALDLKSLTRSVQELKTDMRSILQLLREGNNNNNNNNLPAANPPPVAAGAQQEEAEEGK
jgi:hypothetical protein